MKEKRKLSIFQLYFLHPSLEIYYFIQKKKIEISNKKRKIKGLVRDEIFSRVRRKERTGFAFCCIDYITEA